MPARRAAAVVQPCPAAPDPSSIDTVAAMDRQTAEIARLADNLAHAVERVSPAVEAISNLDHAQKKFCAWVVGNRVKILLSIPVVLTAIGAISPNAARAFGELLKVWGVQ
jgi:hypothetical protein